MKHLAPLESTVRTCTWSLDARPEPSNVDLSNLDLITPSSDKPWLPLTLLMLKEPLNKL